jgi:deoxyxylulose-5-phosphate synthase
LGWDIKRDRTIKYQQVAEKNFELANWNGYLFPKRSESEYDTFGVGHLLLISAALGMAIASNLKRR